jgi:hypothetical protein
MGHPAHALHIGPALAEPIRNIPNAVNADWARSGSVAVVAFHALAHAHLAAMHKYITEIQPMLFPEHIRIVNAAIDGGSVRGIAIVARNAKA